MNTSQDAEADGVRPIGSPAPERVVHIGRNNYGSITLGDHSPIVTLGPLPPVALVSPTRGPVGVPTVPAVSGTTDGFVGRADELAQLERALAAGPGVVGAVYGLGGVGKTALAARYVQLHARTYTQVAWLSAQDAAGIEAGLARFAVALEPGLGMLPLDALAERAAGWLASHDGWLLVLDNVERVADAQGLLARLAGSQGRFLVTSRRATGWSRVSAETLGLGVLAEDEAVELLARILGSVPAGELADACGLCLELGFLPLAIEQAGAFMNQSAVRPWRYLELLATHPGEMYSAGDLETDPQRTIARVWGITLDRLADTPLASEVLRILAWFAPTGIPARLLDGVAPQPALGQAVGVLAAYSLVTRTPTPTGDSDAGMQLAVHRLVQAITRTPDADDAYRDPAAIALARDQAAAMLNEVLPGDWQDPAGWPAYRRLIPHVEAFCRHSTPETDTHAVLRVLSQAGLFLQNQGQFDRARGHLHRAFSGCRRLLGAEHPDTSTSRSNLAYAYQSAGDLRRAILLYEQTVADRSRVLGEDHLQTLASRNDLANAYALVGEARRAIPLLERTLLDARRVLGDEHPLTLICRNSLAIAYQETDDLGRAVPLLEQTLQDARRVLGKDDPQTLTFSNDLAHAYQETDDLGRAVPLLEQTLQDARRVLGDEHPLTLSSRGNLAFAYDSADDLERAIPLYEQTLRDARRLLGEDHPDTLALRSNLAGAYGSAGDLERATPLFEEVLADRIRVLGEVHPETLKSRNNLAAVYEFAGDSGRAMPLLEQTLQVAHQLLGDGHPLTKKVSRNLADARGIDPRGSDSP